MIISAYGLVLLFTSNQANILVSGPYPPFGLATISFMGLSSYLVLVGIYYSAISVAEDSKLRQSIGHFALEEAKLLDSIGTAQMEKQIEDFVMKMTKDNAHWLDLQSGVKPSLTEDDMNSYLAEVID
jgi:hypothetical protein